MKNFTIGVVTLLMSLAMSAQTGNADFEDFGLEPGERINNDITGEGFKSGLVSLPNVYTPAYDSWSGWAISSMMDTLTPGFTNQYSSIVGSGYDGSTSYGVAFDFGENRIDIESEYNSGKGTVGMYVSNSTYAYFSMLEGDAFAKKFGGETGEDPDFLSIVFRGIVDGVVTADSVEFFLADFRSNIASEDYISKEWSWVDLSALGSVNSIVINMRSSDVGAFGINTPLYFCVDNIEVDIDPLNITYQNLEDLKVYPTLAHNSLTVELQSTESAVVELFSLDGKLIRKTDFTGGKLEMNLNQIPQGYYFIRAQQGDAIGIKEIIKQ